MTNLLAFADIRINGARPWDIYVHDRRFFNWVLASGTLGFGESYMDGWWDCDALDEMCCRAIGAGLEKRFQFRPPNVRASLTALLANQESLRRARKVGRVHIGCGWGELARYAARHYSCQVVRQEWIVSLLGNLRKRFTRPHRSLDQPLHFPKFHAAFARSSDARRRRRFHC
jgi:hypothetical protein